MSSEVTLNRESFDCFLRVLSVLAKGPCSDVDVHEGKIRQRSNDRSIIFEIDMSKILGNETFHISDLAKKIILLKTFQNQDVAFTNKDDEFIFRDAYSEIKFLKIDRSAMDNHYIHDSEFSNMFTLDDDSLILNHDIPFSISNKIQIVTQVFNAISLKAEFKDFLFSLKVDSSGKDQFATFINNVTISSDMEGYSNVNLVPFIIDHDGSIVMDMYKFDSKFINSYQTKISDFDVKLYSISSIKYTGDK